MSDLTPDPTDDRVRAALAAEAEGVTAGPELLARIQAAAAATPPSRRIAPWLLVAAVSALVVGLAATLLTDDGGQKVNAAGDPTSTSTTTSDPTATDPAEAITNVGCVSGVDADVHVYFHPDVDPADRDAAVAVLQSDPRVQQTSFYGADAVLAEFRELFADEPLLVEAVTADVLPTRLSIKLHADADAAAVRQDADDLAGVYDSVIPDCAAGTADRPALMALVREDGMLVTIDLATGAETELYTAGDPREEIEGGAYSIDSVELSPDGAWIYFSTCCEPAVGTTFRIPTAGGEPEQVGFGAYPRVSPDGRVVATAGSESLFVFDASAPGSEPIATLAVPCCSSRLAWSPDGTRLALVNGTGAPGELREVLAFTWDGATLTPADLGKPENPGSFISWMPDGTPVTSSGGPIDDERSLSLNATYTWLLWVDEEGVVREQDGHETGDRLPIAGLPEAIAADW